MQPETRSGEGIGIRLRAASSAERPAVFREVYEVELREILARSPRDPRSLQMGTNEKFARFVRGTIGRGRTVLEIGCGFGASALQVAESDNRVTGIDAAPIAAEVANGFAAGAAAPGRGEARFAVMDATRLDFPDASFDAAYSIDLLEHLHPDDVPAHLAEVRRVLRARGTYIVKTPSVLSGPHGGSDPNDPGCAHLQEYSYGTLLPLLRAAGFRRLAAPSFSMRISSRLPGRSRLPARLNLLPEAVARLAAPRSPLQVGIARALGVKQILVVAEKR